jgi:hypothetical protein
MKLPRDIKGGGTCQALEKMDIKSPGKGEVV